MHECKYRVAYDILAEGMGFERIRILILVLVLTALFSFILIYHIRKYREDERGISELFCIIQLLVIWAGAVFIFCAVFSEGRRSLTWAKQGDYKVVEGTVTNFKPMPRSGHAEESFSVNGVTFFYSDYNLSHAGFHNAASHGGPIRQGLHVKISYHDDRILKVEICDDHSGP